MRTIFDSLTGGSALGPAFVNSSSATSTWWFIGDWMEINALASVHCVAGATVTIIVQSAEDSSGTGAATAATICTALTTSDWVAGNVDIGLLAAGHKYVRFSATETAGTDAIVAGILVGIPRYAEHAAMGT